jgi:hypothetical protein
VHTYLMAPPAEAAELLETEARLRRKLRDAESTIGRVFDVVPRLSPVLPDAGDDARPLGEAEADGAVEQLIARWRCPSPREWCRRPIVVAVRACRQGWLAALSDGRLVAALRGSAPDVTTTVRTLVPIAEGSPRPTRDDEVRETLAAVARWLREEHTARECGLGEVRTPTQRDVERILARLLRVAPRHERANAIALASELRARLRSPLSLGIERELRALVGRRTGDIPSGALGWLAEAVQATHRSTAPTNRASAPVRPLAVILFGGGSTED